MPCCIFTVPFYIFTVYTIPVVLVGYSSPTNLVNAIFFTFEAIYLFVPNIWIIFAVVLWEGMLGGGAYVNTFYNISNKIPDEKKEFSMGITSLSDAVGIGIAGAIALPVHNILCQLPKP